ncbi:MAG: 3-isopropylmalate dehydratase small subunit [Deltaproteobacteria bacterium]|nr:3-isopropylmalate dehydratase small subunit [Deltaproteobacteria bacterium]MBW2044719.1 3-isopropylmalate dehydratase small subunit [Deltaproteobacteria bacterium]
MEKTIKGKVWRFSDNVDTDQIFPGRYLSISDPKDMVEHCMEGAGHPRFMEEAREGDIIIAGENFGCGSSREHAVVCLKLLGIRAIVAESFARIFFRNGLNLGIPVVEAPGVSAIEEGSKIEINVETGKITDISTGRSYQGTPIPEFLFKMMEKGGLIAELEEKFLK